MKNIFILFILELCTSIMFEDAMKKLEILGNYIREYIKEKKNNILWRSHTK